MTKKKLTEQDKQRNAAKFAIEQLGAVRSKLANAMMAMSVAGLDTQTSSMKELVNDHHDIVDELSKQVRHLAYPVVAQKGDQQ